MHLDELALDHAFWNSVSSSRPFIDWLLSRTKFSGRALSLVTDEKWHQRWYRDPETGRESETDILLLFQDSANGERVALHIENKPPHGRWREGQAESYRKRAENRKSPLGYVDFQTALLAPAPFIAQHAREAGFFDFTLPYEQVAAFVPEFKVLATSAEPPSLAPARH